MSGLPCNACVAKQQEAHARPIGTPTDSGGHSAPSEKEFSQGFLKASFGLVLVLVLVLVLEWVSSCPRRNG